MWDRDGQPVPINPDAATLILEACASTLAAIGKFCVAAAGGTGFDIYSTVSNGSTVEQTVLAAINGSLYEITVFTGKASSRARSALLVTDRAIPLNQL